MANFLDREYFYPLNAPTPPPGPLIYPPWTLLIVFYIHLIGLLTPPSSWEPPLIQTADWLSFCKSVPTGLWIFILVIVILFKSSPPPSPCKKKNWVVTQRHFICSYCIVVRGESTTITNTCYN